MRKMYFKKNVCFILYRVIWEITACLSCMWVFLNERAQSRDVFSFLPLYHQFPDQKRAPSDTPTSTSLPWKRLREWGRSMFRAGRTDWLSSRAGGEGHQSDNATPNSVTLQNSFHCWLSGSLWISWSAPLQLLVIPITPVLQTHPQLSRCTAVSQQQSIPLRRK